MNCNFKQYLTPYVSALLRLSILYTIQDSIVSPIITVIIHHTENGQNGRVVDVSYSCRKPSIADIKFAKDKNLMQHQTDDVILYIYSIHKHRGNSFNLQDNKMRLKGIRLN